MARKAIPMEGRRFGRLVVLRRAGLHNHAAMWLCRCDCGHEIRVAGCSLRRGITRSCGCLRLETGRAMAAERRNAKLAEAGLASWRNKPVDQLDRAELMEAVNYLAAELRRYQRQGRQQAEAA